MPLIESQKDFIRGVVGLYLDDLPADKEQLSQAIQCINRTFQNTLETKMELEEKDSVEFQKLLIELQQFFAKPHEYLERIQNYNENITIAEIKLSIIEEATHFIQDAAAKIQLTPADIGWNPTELCHSITANVNNNKKFVPDTHSNNNWAFEGVLSIPKGRIYTARLIPVLSDIFDKRYDLNIKVTLPNHIAESTIKIASIPIFRTTLREATEIEAKANSLNLDSNKKQKFIKAEVDKLLDAKEAKFTEEVTHIATKTMETEAQKLILAYINPRQTRPLSLPTLRRQRTPDFLTDNNDPREPLLSPITSFFPDSSSLEEGTFALSEEKKLTPIDPNQPGAQLVTIEFYFNQIQNKKITRSYINQLSQQQVSIIGDPVIIELMQIGILNLNDALNLTPTECNIIRVPGYYQMLVNKSLALSYIKHVTRIQSAILKRPAIINLITCGKLSFIMGKYLSPAIADVLCDTFYYDRILKDKIPFEWIAYFTTEQCKNLLNPFIMRCIALSPPSCCALHVISQSFYTDLLVNHKINYTQLNQITPKTANNLSNPKIQDLINAQAISLHHATQISEQRASIYSAPHVFSLLYLRKINGIQASYIHVELAKYIESQPTLLHYLHSLDDNTGYINYVALKTNAYILGSRLVAIFEDKPFFNANQTFDTIEQIQETFIANAQYDSLTKIDLLQATYKYFIQHIYHLITNALQAIPEDKIPRIYADILEAIAYTSDATSTGWILTMSRIESLVGDKLASPILFTPAPLTVNHQLGALRHNFFAQPPGMSDADVRKFCTSILKVTPIMQVLRPSSPASNVTPIEMIRSPSMHN